MRSALAITATATAALFSSALSAPVMDELWRRASNSVTSDVNYAASKSYTHVIVGCGLGGLTTAVRLSEDPKNTVLCLEAGGDSRTDDRVVSMTQYGKAFGTELDWGWATTPQPAAGGNTKTIRGGKTLGGSTAINNGAWGRGDAAQYDGLSQLGNDGWSWSDIESYMKKSEDWNAPQGWQKDAGAQGDSSAHGTGGPVTVSFTPDMYKGPHQKAYVKALNNALGVPEVSDLAAGNVSGVVSYSQNSMQPTGNQIRVSSATAYLSPVEKIRPNLVVLLNWRGVKMNMASSNNGKHKAASVVAQSTKSGPQRTFKASKGVIVSAGAIRTPLFLEASGIGNADVLKKIGVQQQIDLPGVGKGLIEQTMNSIGSKQGHYDPSGKGPSNIIAFPNIYQVMSNATEVRSWIESNMDSWAQAQVNAGSAVNKAGLLKQYELTVKLIFDDKVGIVELFGDHGYPQSGMGVDLWQMMPFSRGSVHSTDASGFSHPQLNPGYFTNPVDMALTVAGLRAARKTLKDSAIRDGLGETESLPGFSVIPDNDQQGDFAKWQNFVLKGNGGNGFSSVHHPIATASMMSRELGGVVDPNFKVYDTENVWIVDASVLPTQMTAHLSASLYGLAEKAAATIRKA
ncbi:alcohol oxidase [Jaminaea rosea]|uniref:Alcohol oxidase n=1 Tax=Jaminaea rosea TaxID=1569628 RepID=A0A316UW58_9BASI|nr:alcohol oxidase [Jaminaea rosea]PWN28153.1 alcohol oxidase [Jaminaea rosea]